MLDLVYAENKTTERPVTGTARLQIKNLLVSQFDSNRTALLP